MRLDLSEMLRGESRILSFDYYTDSPSNISDVEFTDKTHVVGTVKDMAGYIELSIEATVPYSTHCARCFKTVNGVYSFDFVKPVASKGTLENEDSDDYILIEKNCIDPDEVLLEALELDFPMVFYCKEDCKGLCPKCGKDLNEGECDCSKNKEIDPRLSVLSSLLEK